MCLLLVVCFLCLICLLLVFLLFSLLLFFFGCFICDCLPSRHRTNLKGTSWSHVKAVPETQGGVHTQKDLLRLR